MLALAWIVFGLIPGFLAGALAAHNRQAVPVKSSRSEPYFHTDDRR